VKSALGRGRAVALLGEISDGATKKFRLRCGGRSIEGFVVGHRGGLFAYVNRCRHIAMPMDWVENHFFTQDKKFLICATHGAMYEPATGECVWGPCFGAFLQRVPLRVRGKKVFVYCPKEEEH
jgi:nitrite reductase/ring-hydroxylating ferredoxin subunit